MKKYRIVVKNDKVHIQVRLLFLWLYISDEFENNVDYGTVDMAKEVIRKWLMPNSIQIIYP